VVCVQGALGAFTVTLLLKPLIVTLHLAGGLMTLGTLWWLSLAPDVRSVRAVELPVRQLAGVALVVVAMQVVLGGWTSSNYAGVACPDFPRCQGQWLPATDAAAAFTLAHGPGVDFEHGVLDQPARAAIHLAHRAGAVITALTLLLLATMARSRVPAPRVRAWSLTLAGAIVLQWVIGINLIWRGFPLWLGTAHNFGAAAVLLSTLGLVRALHPRSGGVAVNVLPSHRY
jgi:cytochrome c oxidase assembly protein subunit 15